MNDAAKTRAQFKYNRMQVLYLCDITYAEYLSFQTDTAKAWLEHYWRHAIDIDALMACTIFWNWWMYHWNHIDDAAILQDMYHVKPGGRYSYYRQMHQYVFDKNSGHRDRLTKDFLAMLDEFKTAIKPQAYEV